MQEQRTRPRRELFGSGGSGGGGFGNIFGGSTDSGRMATVHHGLLTENLPVAGMTVAEVRRRFADRLDLDPRSTAQIDGNDVSNDTIVRSGQLLMFTRNSGEKGRGIGAKLL